MKPRERRQLLFDQYAANLRKVRRLVDYIFLRDLQDGVDLDDVVACPLCLRVFDRSALNDPLELDLEHVPPRSLGGTDGATILVCKECNSTAGAGMDSQILEKHQFDDFVRRRPGSSWPVRLTYETGHSLRGEMRHEKYRTLIRAFKISGTGMDGDQRIGVFRPLTELDDPPNQVQVQIRVRNLLEVPAAYVRYAYEILFRTFGYLAVLHPSFDIVRQQIQNPAQILIPPQADFSSHLIDEIPDGIHAIAAPEQLRSYVVVFRLRTKQAVTRKAIVLPALLPDGEEIYQTLADSAGNNFDMECDRLLPTRAYWTDINLAVAVLYESFFGR